MQASATTQIASNQTAQGIERQYSVKEQLAAMMARTLGETGLRSAFQIAHYLLRTQWGGPLSGQGGGRSGWKWTRRQWKARFGVRIRIGQSDSQRAKHMVRWICVAKANSRDGAGHGRHPHGREPHLQHGRMTGRTTAMLPGPERYWIDPKSDVPAQRRRQGKAQQAQARSRRRATACARR